MPQRIDEKTTVTLPILVAIVGATFAGGAWAWSLQNKVEDLMSDVSEIKVHMGLKLRSKKVADSQQAGDSREN